MNGKRIVFLALGCIALTTPATAMATVLSLGANYTFSGTDPAATPPPPWLTAQFDDQNTTGSVTLTLTAVNLTGSEAVKDWLFNLNPTLDPTQLNFSAPTILSGSFANPTIAKGLNAFNADGDGYYDIKIEFATNDGAASRFTDGDAVSFTISGIASLAAGSFNFPSSPGGGEGTYLMAAHVLSTPGGNSGWVATPEPSTFVLFGIGAMSLSACCWRRRKIEGK